MKPKAVRKLPSWVGASVALGAFGALYIFERRRPLRSPNVEDKTVRAARNLTIAAAGALALGLLERPVVAPLAQMVERRNLGLLKIARLPLWLEITLAVVLLDYTLYIWHVLTHRVPFLWRFHLVHHVDLDLDASTALRFHFGELMCSVPWRAAQVALIGVSPLSFSVWQTLLFPSILFHHSNVRLPLAWERVINRLIVTPRMHGIHHSNVRDETDANWSSGLTVWDRLHQTLRLGVPQDAVRIGVPAYTAPAEVTLEKVLTMPFGAERPAWRAPDGHEQLQREAEALPRVSKHELLA